MQNKIKQLLVDALASLQADAKLPADLVTSLTIQIERTRNPEHGDFASNVAMLLTKDVGIRPRDLAALIIAALPACDFVDQVLVAGAGFINFYLTKNAQHKVIADVLQLGEKYGCCDIGLGQSAIVEFVSSNPTGPLHVGHGRGAAYGASVADLLEAIGYKVHREYYVNDAGRQMHILATSIWLRYLELSGEEITLPGNCYRGDYIIEIARRLHVEYKEKLRRSVESLYQDLPIDGKDGGDADFYIDSMVARAKDLLGDDYEAIFQRGLTTIIADIREDLEEFGVVFQEWFYESTLHKSGDIARSIARLHELGHIYEKDGATWFRATAFGDEKDRVVIRENGQYTYFAADIAYHLNKYGRGFDLIIDVLGSDHHGYAPRVQAFLKAAGLDVSKLIIPLVQFAILYRGKTKVQMSTRSGEFVTLRELRKEVGNDAARFFYVMRKNDQHLDFDLDLAKSQSKDNPVYYIQYAHARVCSVLRQLEERNLDWDMTQGLLNLHLLSKEHEDVLVRCLGRYAEVLQQAALKYEPHLLAHYLQELANDFHAYYNAEQFLVDDVKLRHARLCLIVATRQVLKNGLFLLGVFAPETM